MNCINDGTNHRACLSVMPLFVEITLGDFALMGACEDGAHKNWMSCEGYTGQKGQNLCCPQVFSTYEDIVNWMYTCLQQMWDEVRFHRMLAVPCTDTN